MDCREFSRWIPRAHLIERANARTLYSSDYNDPDVLEDCQCGRYAFSISGGTCDISATDIRANRQSPEPFAVEFLVAPACLALHVLEARRFAHAPQSRGKA